VYNPEEETHVEWMLKVESGIPSHWDYESKVELAKEGYHLS